MCNNFKKGRDFLSRKPMQEHNPCEIQEQKAKLKQSWDFQQQYMLQMMSDAMSWKCSSEQYNCLVRDYYIARQKHQKEVMRLNQILYSSENSHVHGYMPSSVSSGTDQVMADRQPLKETQQCLERHPVSKKRERRHEDGWYHQEPMDKKLHAS